MGRNALALDHESHEKMAAGHVLGAHVPRLVERDLDHVLHPRRSDDVLENDPLIDAEHRFDLLSDLFDVDAKTREDLAADAFLIPQEPEQQVLGADVGMLERSASSWARVNTFLASSANLSNGYTAVSSKCGVATC